MIQIRPFNSRFEQDLAKAGAKQPCQDMPDRARFAH